MSLDLHIHRQYGDNEQGKTEHWVSVNSRDMATCEHCIPCLGPIDEPEGLTMLRLHRLVLEAYQAGQRHGKEEIRACLRDAIGVKK
jgi:hypothetical protein